jgi:RimJ/RimL family protein N-acetyltransferase
MEKLLETSDFYLRQFNYEDSLLLYELDSDPEVMKFITKGVKTPLRQIEYEILPRILAYYKTYHGLGVWAAHTHDDHKFIGWFHLRPDRIEPPELELGYRLKKDYWGRGFATSGSKALLEMGFGKWKALKICARTLAENAASQRVMEKAGLHFEKKFVYSLETIPDWPEKDRRAVKYSLTRDDYYKQA